MDVCPLCGRKTLRTEFREEIVPHFGRVLLSLAQCTSCGYKHTDIVELEDRGPKRFELYVDTPEKLNYYVIRSSTGRLEIPEVGMELSPGPFSQGFITTVEGVLHRFLDVLPLFERSFGEEKVKKVREFLENAVEGKRPFTLVLEDPRGLSRIVGGASPSRPRDDETP